MAEFATLRIGLLDAGILMFRPLVRFWKHLAQHALFTGSAARLPSGPAVPRRWAASIFGQVVTLGLLFTHAPHALAQTIDPCLIGMWEATSLGDSSGRDPPPTGGAGFRISFTAGGTETIDYGSMTPIVDSQYSQDLTGKVSVVPADTEIWEGTASLRVTTDANIARIGQLVNNGVEEQFSGSGAGVTAGRPGLLGPGALGSTSGGDPYTCSASSLQYVSSFAAANGVTGQWDSVSLARVSPLPLPPLGAINGRSWLTPTEIKDRPQDLQGVWRQSGSASNLAPLWWLSLARTDIQIGGVTAPVGTLLDGEMPSRDLSSSAIRLNPIGSGQWAGQIYVCPEPAGTCPNLCDWVPGAMQIDANNTSARIDWHAKKNKADCSGNTDVPDDGYVTLTRVIGVSFDPLIAGKYLDLVGAPAVGDQAAQFQAAVQLTAKYDSLEPAQVKATADHGTVTLKDPRAGTYEFVDDQSGTSELRFDVVGSDGTIFHTDRVRIDIPGIPGVGK